MAAGLSPPDRAAEGRADPGGHARQAAGGIRSFALRVRDRMSGHDVPSLAAGVAFTMFLSLFPSLAAGVAITTLVVDPISMADRASELMAPFPDAAEELVVGQVRALTTGEGAGGVAVFGLLGGVWAATSAAAMLIKALNRINGVTEARNFLRQRIVALALVVALFSAIAAVAVLLVLGPQLQERVLPPRLLGGAVEVLLGVAQIAGAVVVLALLFAFVYWIGPNRERPRWHWFSRGALVGVVGWLVLSGLFALYVQIAGQYEATYSTFAGVIVTLLWLQLSMTVLLIGAEVNAENELRQGSSEAVVEGAGQALVEPPADPVPTGETVTPRAAAPPSGASASPSARGTGVAAVRKPAALAAVAATAAALAALAVLAARRLRP